MSMPWLCTLCVDVDDTLVRWHGQQVHAHAGGDGWGAPLGRAERAALAVEHRRRRLLPRHGGRTEPVRLLLPHAYLDDQSVDEWRGAQHALPSNAADSMG